MKKIVCLTITISLLLLLIVGGGCENKQKTATPQVVTIDKACPNCNGIGRYGTCVECGAGRRKESCTVCSGAGTRPCGYCNGRGTVPSAAYSSVVAQQQRDTEKQVENKERRKQWQQAYDGIRIGQTEREVLALLNPNHPEVQGFSRSNEIQVKLPSGITVRRYHISWARKDAHFGYMNITAAFENDRVSRKSKNGF